MRRKRLIWQLFPYYLLITLLSLLAVSWYAGRSWRQFYLEQTTTDLTARARLMESLVREGFSPNAGPFIDTRCKDLGKNTATRFTVILPSGKVLGDSEEDPARMDNHADRREIQEALQGRVGVSTRFSFTLGHERMYVAVPLKDGDRVAGVVRASLPMAAIAHALRVLYWQIALGALIIALGVVTVSLLISRRLTQPLEDLKRGAHRFAQGDLGRKLPLPDSDELGSLAEALNRMAAQLEERIRSLQQQGQEQSAILASMEEGVLALDPEGRVLTLNRAGAELLGIDAGQAENRSIQEVVRDPEFQWFVTRTLSAQEPLDGEVTLAGGGKRLLQAHGTPLSDPQGLVLGTLVVFQDVTHLRQLENARRDFVANVSHELKTPITSIKGYVETLLAGALKEPENAEKFLHIIGKHADRLNEIIDDLLSLSRIERDAERGMVFLTAENLQGVLQAAIQVCGPQAAAKDITVHLSCPENLRAPINAPLLEQALVNLVDNAIKFSGPGSTVQVEAARTATEIVIRVRDQGCGIPAEHLPRIFERFYRADAGRSRKVGGTGLGLAIVKHIAQAHNGRVEAESTPAQGSVFTLHLPAD